MSEPISNEAVEAADRIANELPQFSGEHITKHRGLVLGIIQSAITKACAERDEKIRKQTEEQRQLNDVWFETAEALGLSGDSIFPTDLPKAARSLSAQLAVMKEVTQELVVQLRGSSIAWAEPIDRAEAVLSNLPAAAEELLKTLEKIALLYGTPIPSENREAFLDGQVKQASMLARSAIDAAKTKTEGANK